MKNTFVIVLAGMLAAGALLLFGADLPHEAITAGVLSGVAVIGVSVLVYWRLDRKAILAAADEEEITVAKVVAVPPAPVVDVAAWARRLRERDALAAGRETQTSLDSEKIARGERAE